MKTLGGKVVSVTRSGNYQYAIVESINNGLATIRLSTGGTRLTNLAVIGAMPKVGDTVIVDYSSNIPYIRVALGNDLVTTTPGIDPAPTTLPTNAAGASGLLSISSTPASNSFTGITTTFTAGGTLALGDPVYIDGSGNAVAADTNAISTGKCVAICTQSLGTSESGTFLLLGFLNGGFGFTPGGFVYVAVGGGLTQTAPTGSLDCVVIVGVAISSNVLYVNPQLVIVELL